MISLKAFFAPTPQPPINPAEEEVKARELVETSRELNEKVGQFYRAATDFEQTVKEFLDNREAHHNKPRR